MATKISATFVLHSLVGLGIVTKEHLGKLGLELKTGYHANFDDLSSYAYEVLSVTGVGRTLTSKRGVRYSRVLELDGKWSTIYPTPEDAQRAAMLRLSDEEERRFKHWLKERMIFNH